VAADTSNFSSCIKVYLAYDVLTMALTLEENLEIDLSFLQKELVDLKSIQAVNPNASLPFDYGLWKSFFNLKHDTKAYSYYVRFNDKRIGHFALKSSRDTDNNVFICFVYLKEEFRGKGFAKNLIRMAEECVGLKFNALEYYLNVNTNNERAIAFYEKVGFKKTSQDSLNIQMMKRL